jgi:hypothetical protein
MILPAIHLIKYLFTEYFFTGIRKAIKLFRKKEEDILVDKVVEEVNQLPHKSRTPIDPKLIHTKESMEAEWAKERAQKGMPLLYQPKITVKEDEVLMEWEKEHGLIEKKFPVAKPSLNHTTTTSIGSTLYLCGFCSKGYKTQRWLNNHIHTKHIDDLH